LKKSRLRVKRKSDAGANHRFQFQFYERSQLFICTHNETLSVAVSVSRLMSSTVRVFKLQGA
jgi:hypothetical protein